MSVDACCRNAGISTRVAKNVDNILNFGHLRCCIWDTLSIIKFSSQSTWINFLVLLLFLKRMPFNASICKANNTRCIDWLTAVVFNSSAMDATRHASNIITIIFIDQISALLLGHYVCICVCLPADFYSLDWLTKQCSVYLYITQSVSYARLFAHLRLLSHCFASVYYYNRCH